MAETYEIDELDRKILGRLQENGRKSFREIAKEVDSTAVTVINRVDKMKEKGIIQGYTVRVDYKKLDYQVLAAIEIVVKGEHLKEVEERLFAHPNVTATYEITGDTDVLIIAKFRDRDELGSFVVEYLLDSEQVEKTITHVAFGDYGERFNLDLEEIARRDAEKEK